MELLTAKEHPVGASDKDQPEPMPTGDPGQDFRDFGIDWMLRDGPWTPPSLRLDPSPLKNISVASPYTHEPSYAPSTTNSSVFFSAKSAFSGGSALAGTGPKQASSQNHPKTSTTYKNYPKEPTTYENQLADLQLWPVDPSSEQNWSGRGQHAEFQKTERELVDSILRVWDTLGSSSSAVVESVRCKRILLARKTIRCISGRHMTREKVIEEVAHLTKLHHAHIVRVIGTYILGRDISILIYPVAEYTLQTFLSEMLKKPSERDGYFEGIFASLYMGCLSHALAHVHDHLIKHMDIKPQNILVQKTRRDFHGFSPFRVYLADFGIARSYKNHEDTETDGPTMFTRKYAAPEVVDQDKRGLPADIYSLGCVFLEMAVADSYVIGQSSKSFAAEVGEMLGSCFKDGAYQADLDSMPRLLQAIGEYFSFLRSARWPLWHLSSLESRRWPLWFSKVEQMMDIDPLKRPTAQDLVLEWGENICCVSGLEPLQAWTE